MGHLMKLNIALIFMSFLFVSSANAQAISSQKLMEIADKIYGISMQMSAHNVGADQAEKNRWSSLRQSVYDSAQEYRLAALETAIVEQKVDIPLRQYRLGKKLADSTNQNEAFFHTWRAYKIAENSIEYLQSMAVFYPNLNQIQRNLSTLNAQTAPYVQR